MAYSRHRNQATWTDRAVGWVFAISAFLHHLAGAAIRLLLAGLAWLLRPLPWSCRFGLMATLLAVTSLLVGRHGYEWGVRAASLQAEHLKILRQHELLQSFEHLLVLFQIVGWLCFFAALMAFVRRRFSSYLLKTAGAAFLVAWCWLVAFIVRVPGLIHAIDKELLPIWERDTLWLQGVAIWLPWAGAAIAFLLSLTLGTVYRYYHRPVAARPPLGDRVVADLRTHGGDRRFRTSFYWAAFGHLFVLFILPLLNRGCMQDPYGIPKGDGMEVQQVVEVKRVKKQDEMVLNLNSPILIYRPKIDESKIFDEVDKITENQYQATSLKSLGKGGGKGGGWPHGMENAMVRFIRLKYGGGDWDQQMGKGADHNLLVQFKKHTGFKIASDTEAIEIHLLRRYPAHRAPPFVFITGSGNISISSTEARILRWYALEEGGLIFADNGGGNFNSSFRRMMSQVFPDKEWVDIASDDIIYQQPFLFPNGAPPMWQHSGSRALGLKHNGRWIVFYHQGDLNDAWQTGHSGITEGKADLAYKMGINVINYAFNAYYTLHYGE